jgi:hypothetical protein
MGPPAGTTRGRFGLTGDGETGSPRRRFRARDTAETGCEEIRTCDEDATGWIRGNGSGDNSLRSASFRGVENGFETEWICSTRKALSPLFLTGEKGLVDVTGGSTLTAFDFEINSFDCRLGGVDGCVLALFNLLYSLYFSAEGNGIVNCVHGTNC